MQNNEQATQAGTEVTNSSAPATEGRTAQPAETPEPNEFAAVKTRLEEIARAVDDESISLDDALDLYEEAVKLGLKASDLLEVGIVVPEEQADEAASGAEATSGAEAASGDEAASTAAAAKTTD